MYSILKRVINQKGYELKDMLNKINSFWATGAINEEEHNELIELAQNNAHIRNEVDVLKKLEELEQRVKSLENKSVEAPEEDEGLTEDEAVSYPEYVVGKWYYNGDIVTFEGETYICTAPSEQVCVWSPTEYPAYWDVYELPLS